MIKHSNRRCSGTSVCSQPQSGFTLIEVLVVVGLIAILAAVVMVAINPGRQFAQARDSQRRSDIRAIATAIYQYAAEHEGNLPDTDGDPTTSNFPDVLTCVGIDVGCFNLAQAGDDTTVVPTYLSEIPQDPTRGDDGNAGYLIGVDENGRVIASASGELEGSISITR